MPHFCHRMRASHIFDLWFFFKNHTISLVGQVWVEKWQYTETKLCENMTQCTHRPAHFSLFLLAECENKAGRANVSVCQFTTVITAAIICLLHFSVDVLPVADELRLRLHWSITNQSADINPIEHAFWRRFQGATPPPPLCSYAFGGEWS